MLFLEQTFQSLLSATEILLNRCNEPWDNAYMLPLDTKLLDNEIDEEKRVLHLRVIVDDLQDAHSWHKHAFHLSLLLMTPRIEHPLKSLLGAHVSLMKELGLSLNFSKNMWKGKKTKAKDIKWTLQLNVKFSFSTCHMKAKLLGYQSYQLATDNKYKTCQIILSAPWPGTFT
jgi:hypothetical protein